jgi:hypothetical protein
LQQRFGQNCAAELRLPLSKNVQTEKSRAICQQALMQAQPEDL